MTMEKKNRLSRGDFEYVIHCNTAEEKSYSDDVGNTFEIVEMKKKSNKELPNSIWKYFSLAKNICDGVGKNVVCTLCFDDNEVKTYSKVTSTTNLWRHLQLKHGIYEFKPKDEPKELGTEAAIGEMMNEVIDDGEKDPEDTIDGEGSFSGDINISLIQEIFNYPEILDYKNSKASNQDRANQWNKVASQFKGIVDLDHIKKAWKNIRDRYKKVKNKEMRTGVVQPPEKRYKYYDLINELDVTGVLFNADGHENSESDGHHVDSSQGPAIKKRRMSNSHEEFTNIEYLNDGTLQFDEIYDDEDPMFEEEEVYAETKTVFPPKANMQQSRRNDDEYSIFGNLIAEKLRRMPKQRANRLEMKVLALLLVGDE